MHPEDVEQQVEDAQRAANRRAADLVHSLLVIGVAVCLALLMFDAGVWPRAVGLGAVLLAVLYVGWREIFGSSTGSSD
ncbi:MAG: hypothetical protein EKK53_23850 [Burkholderiales bacterium]|nr:MAG: hypothetical protein EKK53_23850 [Burkholderiales bacterium]